MKIKLKISAPEDLIGEHSLTLPTILGRGKESDLKLPQLLVSRKHCELRQEHGNVILKDLGSLNGTFVDGERVESEMILHSGMQILVGNTVLQLIVEDQANEHNVAALPVEAVDFERSPVIQVPEKVFDINETLMLPAAEASSFAEENLAEPIEEIESFDFQASEAENLDLAELQELELSPLSEDLLEEVAQPEDSVPAEVAELEDELKLAEIDFAEELAVEDLSVDQPNHEDSFADLEKLEIDEFQLEPEDEETNTDSEPDSTKDTK